MDDDNLAPEPQQAATHQFPAAPLPMLAPSLPARLAALGGGVALFAPPGALADLARWPSEDVARRDQEEEDVDEEDEAAAGAYATEAAWAQAAEVPGFVGFKEDLAALLEVPNILEAVWTAPRPTPKPMSHGCPI